MTDAPPTEPLERRSPRTSSRLGVVLASPVFRWATIAYVAVVLGVMAFLYLSNVSSRLEWSGRMVQERQMDLAVRFADLAGRIDTLEQRVREIETGPETGRSAPMPANEDTVELTGSTTLRRLDVLEESLTALRQDHQTLRTVLNPTDPTAVLTVLRLGDKFELITNELDFIRTNLDDTKQSIDLRIQQNYQSTIKHVDAVTNIFLLMGLLLVPLLAKIVADLFPRKGKNAEAGHD